MPDGNFDLSAVMRFDGKQAVAGADEVTSSLKGIAAANKEVAASAREATSAGSKKGAQADGTDAKREAQGQREAAAALKEKTRADKEAAAAAKALATEEAKLEAELQKIRDALDPTAAAQRKVNAELDIAATGFARGKLSAAEYEATVQRLTGSNRVNAKEADAAAKAMARNAFGARNLGQQVGDFATQVSLGGGFIRAFSSQAGQAGFALSEMGGKAGAVGAFLTGPWGIALTVAALVLAPFVEELFKASEGLTKVELGSSGLADSQGALGEIFDLVTGKLKKQNVELSASNELLRLNARLTAINLRTEALKEKADSEKALRDVGSISGTDRVRGAAEGLGRAGNPLINATLGAFSGTERGNQNATNLRNVVSDLRSGKTTNEQALRAAEKIDFTGLKVDREGFLKAIVGGVSSSAKRQIADLTDKALNENALPSALRRDGTTKKPPKAKSTAAVDEFGRDAADKIEALRDQLSETPSVVAAVNKQLAQLDDLIDDIGRKKPPGFEKLIADAQALRPLIQAGLNKPYRDYLSAQEDGLAVQRLITAGKVDEAAALKIVQGLQRDMAPLTIEQRDAVLATVQAMRLEQREADILRDKQQAYLTALGSIKSAVRGVIFDGVGGIEALPGRLVNAFSTLKGEQLFDKLFDGAFRDLEDQAKGTNVVRDASDRMAAAVDKTRSSAANLGTAFDGLATKVANSTAAAGSPAASATAALTGGGKFDPKAFGELLRQTPSAPDPLAPAGSGGEIVVAGKKTGKSPTDFFGGAIERISRGLGIGASQKDRDASIADSLKSGIKIGDDAASKIGAFSGKAIKGAATGAFTNSIFAPLAKGLGLKTSATGAKIGGAIGGLTGLPGGDIIGSIAGSVIGGLFKKSKFGTSTLNIADGIATAGASTGRGAAEKANASALGGSLADGLNSVAQALGATLGTANVSIGYRPGHKAGAYRVDPTGRGAVKNGSVAAFETEQEAVAFAIRDAILDGAVTGLSAAMQKALASSTDIDKSLKEALGVKALEARLGGLSGTLKATFDAEDAAGKERVRLARSYGLDLVATEKINAEERSKLLADTLESRLGGLTSFSSSLQFGDLAEGTAGEKLKALQVEIDKVQKQAEAGVDGAANTLAGLLAQKVSQARDAFGTAGSEYRDARGSSISAVDRVIQMETDRINSAAGITTSADTKATTAAVKTVAEGVNETNDILTRIASSLAAGAGISATNSPNSFTPVTARFSSLV